MASTMVERSEVRGWPGCQEAWGEGVKATEVPWGEGYRGAPGLAGPGVLLVTLLASRHHPRHLLRVPNHLAHQPLHPHLAVSTEDCHQLALVVDDHGRGDGAVGRRVVHLEAAGDRPRPVLHQVDVEALQEGLGEHLVRLHGVRGDGHEVAVYLHEGFGHPPQLGDRHLGEVALHVAGGGEEDLTL